MSALEALCLPACRAALQTVLLDKARSGIGPDCHAQRGCSRCALLHRLEAGSCVFIHELLLHTFLLSHCVGRIISTPDKFISQ